MIYYVITGIPIIILTVFGIAGMLHFRLGFINNLVIAAIGILGILLLIIAVAHKLNKNSERKEFVTDKKELLYHKEVE